MITPPKFNCLPLKIYGWKTILSFWGPAYFEGRTVELPGSIDSYRFDPPHPKQVPFNDCKKIQLTHLGSRAKSEPCVFQKSLGKKTVSLRGHCIVQPCMMCEHTFFSHFFEHYFSHIFHANRKKIPNNFPKKHFSNLECIWSAARCSFSRKKTKTSKNCGSLRTVPSSSLGRPSCTRSKWVIACSTTRLKSLSHNAKKKTAKKGYTPEN